MGKKLFKNLDLFIFDMDGLLFDTETIYVNYGKELAKEAGYIITDEIIEKTTGMMSAGPFSSGQDGWPVSVGSVGAPCRAGEGRMEGTGARAGIWGGWLKRQGGGCV